MAAIRIEPDESPKVRVCGECAGQVHLTHGYVYADEIPAGVYFLEWCDGDHPTRAAFLTIGLGDFGDDDSSRREAFAIEWHREGMSLTDEPVRDRPELLGRFVGRDEALARPDLSHLWHVADHVVLDDPRGAVVQDWLNAD